MSIKQAKSKAFKKGRKVGYWLAMQNIKKSKKLEISDQKPIWLKKGVYQKRKPKKPEDYIKPKPQSKPKPKPKPQSKPKPPQPKPSLEIDEKVVYYDYESTVLESHDIGIQNELKNEIKLAIDEALNNQTILPEDEYDLELQRMLLEIKPGDPFPTKSEELELYKMADEDYNFNILNEEDKKLLKRKKGSWWKNDDDLDNELQRMIEQVKPEDPLPTPSEEAELFAMADDY